MFLITTRGDSDHIGKQKRNWSSECADVRNTACTKGLDFT